MTLMSVIDDYGLMASSNMKALTIAKAFRTRLVDSVGPQVQYTGLNVDQNISVRT